MTDPRGALERILAAPDGRWLVAARRALIELHERADGRMRNAAEYWLGALGAWVLADEHTPPETTLGKVADFLALGFDELFADGNEAVRKIIPGYRGQPLALQVLISLADLCKSARGLLRADSAAAPRLDKALQAYERGLKALRASVE